MQGYRRNRRSAGSWHSFTSPHLNSLPDQGLISFDHDIRLFHLSLVESRHYYSFLQRCHNLKMCSTPLRIQPILPNLFPFFSRNPRLELCANVIAQLSLQRIRVYERVSGDLQAFWWRRDRKLAAETDTPITSRTGESCGVQAVYGHLKSGAGGGTFRAFVAIRKTPCMAGVREADG